MWRQTQRWAGQVADASTVCTVACLLACFLASAAGSQAQAPKQSEAEKVLIQKAQALEARGRPDIAVQVWQQILLSDPNNPLALEGVARDNRLSGNSAASDAALDKLRKINPSDPNIGKIQGLTSNKTRDARLGQAGALAKAGNPEAAMKIYREYYGDHPPDGDIALAYYETLYATPNGKTEALNAMRAAAARNPGDPRFIVTLGRMLTYDARTRAEGIKILHQHMDNSDAQNSLRQALIWDSANPTSAAELREYLKTHPKDTELQGRLKANEGKLAEMNAGIARTPEEKAAFAALNAHHLQEAEARFQAMLDKNDKDARVAAGMGFLRMQQNNFGAAISYLVQAEQNGFRDRSVVEGLATSRFWYTMGEASLSFDVNQLDVAVEKYKAALEMRPRSPEALNGLAGVYTKNQQYSEAAKLYTNLLKVQPSSVAAWRGLFLSYARDHQTAQALAFTNRFPAGVKSNLSRDPEYLQALASIYQAKGDDAAAQKVLAQALALPFPDDGATLKTGTRLQYAGILVQAKRYDQAGELYKQILNDDTNSLPAWMGLVTADHELQLDREAVSLVEKMPPDTYEAALGDPGFLSMLGSIYQQSNQLEIAQGLLERAAKLEAKAGGQPSLGAQIQLAAIYLQRNNTVQAYGLYHQILEAHPDNLDAWRGLIGAMQQTHRDKEALQEIKLIPPAIRAQLEQDVQFEQSEASLYAGAGDSVNAIVLFNRVQKHYAALGQQPPADVEIQSAYILYNTFNDRALYPELMQLGARTDLTDAQRETIQGLWANWSVRRSATAFENGNTARAIDILDAAAQAFPDNPMVRKAVAGGYLKAGKSKEALSIFKQIDFQDAIAGDFQGAIGAALAANDKAQAETWLRQALDRYPRDAAILAEAARFEQARGDNARAADYWRASLAAMPEVTPVDKLAHELVNPEPIKGVHAATPNDLANMLNPDLEPAEKPGRTTKLPPLPAYGHDPYDPGPPVILKNQSSNGGLPSRQPVYPVPTTTTVPLPKSEVIQSTPQPPAPLPVYRPQSSTTGKRTVPTTTRSSTVPQTQTGKPSAANPPRGTSKDSASANYTGRMHLPAGDDTVTDTTTSAAPAPNTSYPAPQPTPSTAPQFAPLPVRPLPVYPQLVPQDYQQPKQKSTQPGSHAELTPQPGLRISAQPMNPQAARVQALLTDETDSQLTQGLSIRYLPNAAVPNAGFNGQSTSPAQPQNFRTDPRALTMSNTQYTPSAQDAAAGAYSAQKPNQPVPQPQTEQPPLPALQPTPPQPQQPALQLGKVRKKRKSKPTPAGEEVPTLVTAPPQQSPLPVTEVPTQSTQTPTATGLSDQELQERNLPPLRGPWVRNAKREPAVLNPRDEAEMQLRQIEGGYSAWLGGTGVVAHRTGAAGYDGLNTLDASFEASTPLGTRARVTFIAKPVFLDSGQADGTAQATLSSGVVPDPFGTGAASDGGVNDPSAHPPAQQNAAGIAGEAQLTFANLGVGFGTTPRGFLVANYTGRASFRPGRGPLTLSFIRDSVKDTQLSYAGLRDPFSATAFFPGNIWGGVVANQANIQFAKGDLNSGFYVGAGGQYLTGFHVVDNRRIDGSMGAYFRVYTIPEYGTLNVGANFFGMHYSKNLQAFTYGMGGYFSPQAYFLANIPVTWTGHYQTRWHYTILGSFGVQAFSEDAEPLFPLDPATEVVFKNPSLPALTSVGPNYDLRGQVAYAISDHWFVGGTAAANNSRNYTTVNAGFSIRYLFRSQPSTVAGPTGLFQTDDAHALRPLTVP
jgi:tetratricopeptide (TPR) repeat protein